MVDYKEINAAKFKENLIGNFGDNDKVQILFDELVENNTEKNPFFYSIILTHIEKNHLSITDLVDSKNQVHFDKINVAIVEAEKQFQEKQNVEKEKSERNNQNNEQINNDKEDIRNQLKAIDFKNIKAEDIGLFLHNFEKALDTFDSEELEDMANATSEQLKKEGFKEDFVNSFHMKLKLLACAKAGKLSKELNTPEVQQYLAEKGIDIDDDLNLSSNKDGEAPEDILKSDKETHDYVSIIELVRLSTDKENFEQRLNLPENSKLKEFWIKQGLSFDDIYQKKEEAELQSESKLEGDNLEQKSIEDEPSTVRTIHVEADVETIHVETEDFFDNLFEETIDFAENMRVEQEIQTEDQPQPELADEEVQNEATEEVQDERQEVEEDIEEIEEEIQEEAKEEIPEEQYEAPTFEEEKTGLAGLFSRIANSRAVKAVTNLFKPKEEQKRLNAPANQRVEDGVRFTDYESNGSLLPATIQTRNFFRNFAINTVEAVTKFAKNISGRGKQDNQVINTPTVIKSEPTKAQTEKTITQEQQQTVEKTETFNDTNKWAVSNEAIQRQEAINKAQERNNLSHVAAPKQEELQSEEDKSFEEI